jgi:hypothetical protein
MGACGSAHVTRSDALDAVLEQISSGPAWETAEMSDAVGANLSSKYGASDGCAVAYTPSGQDLPKFACYLQYVDPAAPDADSETGVVELYFEADANGKHIHPISTATYDQLLPIPSEPTSTAPHLGTTAPSASADGATPRSGTPTTSSAPTSTAQSTATFDGRTFMIEYPAAWRLESAEMPQSWGGTDTTIVASGDPSVLIRVDVKTTGGAEDPAGAARAVIESMSSQTGYQVIDKSPTTLAGAPALRWHFLVTEAGVVMEKEDVFAVSPVSGVNVAVLTQAPASEYSSLAPEFAALRSSLTIKQ